MAKQTTQTTQDELARELLAGSDAEQALLGRIGELKRARFECESSLEGSAIIVVAPKYPGQRPVIESGDQRISGVPHGEKGDGQRVSDYLRPRREKLAVIEKELAAAGDELSRLRRKMNPLVAQSKVLAENTESARQERMADAIRQAADSAVSRQIYIDASAKLTDLRTKLVKAEAELQRLETAPAATAASTQSRAEHLLVTGELPETVRPDAQVRLDALNLVRTLARAVAIQQATTDEACRTFSAEVNEKLRQAKEGILQRIVRGYSEARAAARDALVLRAAFSRAGCDPEVMESCRFQGVPVMEARDSFDFWVDGLRRQGYLV